MREAGEHRNNTKDAGAFLIRLTLVQLLAAGALLAVFLFAAKRGGSLFAELGSAFGAATAEDWDLGEVTFFPADPETPSDETESGEAQTGEAASAEETAASDEGAGGEDLPDGGGDLVCLACYTCGDTPVLPVEGRVTSVFGERVHPIYGTTGFHSGKDLAAAEGTPIHAALDGEVIGAGVGEMSGNYVKLRHEDGLETLYCHCSRLNVETGVRVRKGDVIAFVGETGLATGPHLHFEVHIDGVKRDPDYLLENACHVA